MPRGSPGGLPAAVGGPSYPDGVRLLHTSDWHLGRSFHEVRLLDAQARFLDHVVDVVRSERVDAVLVSGDVYDRALPGPEIVELLSTGVTRLVDAGAQVILSSGNHDSAIRLGFAADLLARAGLHIRTSVTEIDRPVLVGDAAVFAVPYLEPSVVAPALGTEDVTHTGVLTAAMDRVRAAASAHPGPTIVMAHAFVAGAATCGSERDITVGGAASVSPRVFDGIGYAALGHLHGAQRLTESVRYSGSPLAMSFSEAGHTKGSWLVDIDAHGRRNVELVEAPVPRPLAVLRGQLAGLLADPALAWAETAWCQVTLTDAARPLGAMDRLRRRFPGTLELAFDPPPVLGERRTYAARVASTATALDVCCDFLAHVRGGTPATDEERALFAEAVEGGRLASGATADEGRARHPVRGVA